MTNLADMITELGNTFNEKAGDLHSRLTELEKRAAREPVGDHLAAEDDFPRGAALLDSKDVQNLSSTFRGKAVVKLQDERAAITGAPTTVGSNTSVGTSLVPAHRVPGIVAPYERELRVRDVIGSARTTSNQVEFPRETGFTNNAAPVAETTLKPQSDLEFELFN